VNEKTGEIFIHNKKMEYYEKDIEKKKKRWKQIENRGKKSSNCMI